MFSWIVLIAAVAAIAWVNWFFLMAPKAALAAKASATAQEVTVAVEGGYSPAVVLVKSGVRLRLIFDRKEKAPCSEEVVIAEFGIRRFLKPFEKTVIELTPAKPGSYEFVCGMGMLRGRIEVQA